MDSSNTLDLTIFYPKIQIPIKMHLITTMELINLPFKINILSANLKIIIKILIGNRLNREIVI